jgi:hypothetical protein
MADSSTLVRHRDNGNYYELYSPLSGYSSGTRRMMHGCLPPVERLADGLVRGGVARTEIMLDVVKER